MTSKPAGQLPIKWLHVLMPEQKFKRETGGSTFSLDTIARLSESFHASGINPPIHI